MPAERALPDVSYRSLDLDSLVVIEVFVGLGRALSCHNRRFTGSGARLCQSGGLAGIHGSCHCEHPETSLAAPAGPQVPWR